MELFCQELDEVIRKVNKKYVLNIQDDWNAKIGADAYKNWYGIVGKFVLENTNDGATHLLEFAKQHGLVVANTFSTQKIKNCNMHSPGGISHNQIL